MSSSATTEPARSCDFKADSFACQQEAAYDLEGKHYCVLHFPSMEKSQAFRSALVTKLQNQDFTFRGAWFPDEWNLSYTYDQKVDFAFAVFNAKVNFEGCEFRKGADFSNAIFEKAADANFSDAKFFAAATFDNARFKGIANFDRVTFCLGGGASFRSTTFNNNATFKSSNFQDRVVFDSAIFEKEANFWLAGFEGYARFAGTKRKPLFSYQFGLEFRHARIVHPELVSFSNLELRPSWFVGVDPREFEFIKIDWDRIDINEEIKSLKKRKGEGDQGLIQFPHDLLLIACQRLATNYEENYHFDEASMFRYMVMDVRRRESWRGFEFWRLRWWYWLASGYGERVWRASFVLVGLWLLFASIFFFGQQNGQWWQPAQTKVPEQAPTAQAQASEAKTPGLLGFGEALIYSAGVMTLQKPEPPPASRLAKTLILLETVLGPVQAALLALAIRRKFMR